MLVAENSCIQSQYGRPTLSTRLSLMYNHNLNQDYDDMGLSSSRATKALLGATVN